MKLLFITLTALICLSSCSTTYNIENSNIFFGTKIDLNGESETDKVWKRLNEKSLEKKPVQSTLTSREDQNGNIIVDTKIE